MLKKLSIFIILLLTSYLHANPLKFRNVVYDDKEVAELITVITSTSPIPSIPSTQHIYQAQASLFRIPALQLCKKIIVFDGIPEHKKHLTSLYTEYQQNILHLTQTDPYFSNTQLVFCPTWGHLSGTVEEALKHVTTPYVFIHQHDLVIKKDFDLNRAVATLVANPNIKYIHFSSSSNRDLSWNGRVDNVVLGRHFVPLSRSFGWSDRTHIASVYYYKKFVLPLCDHCFMEDKVHYSLKRSVEKYGEKAHSTFGSYLYGNLSDGCYIEHTDGRNN